MYLRGRVKNQHLHTPPTCGSTSGPLSTVSTVTYKKCASQQIGPTVSFIGFGDDDGASEVPWSLGHRSERNPGEMISENRADRAESGFACYMSLV